MKKFCKEMIQIIRRFIRAEKRFGGLSALKVTYIILHGDFMIEVNRFDLAGYIYKYLHVLVMSVKR